MGIIAEHMRLGSYFFLVVILLMVNFSAVSLNTQALGELEEPKVAVLGDNTDTISSNVAGGRFYYNFSSESGKGYNFELSGDENTKFDLYLFDSQYYPTVILDESKEFADTTSYPVTINNFSTENTWIFIQVFSNHMNGGTGDFTLTISQVNNQNNGPDNDQSDNSDTDGWNFVIIAMSMSVITLFVIINRRFKQNRLN